MVTTPIVAPPGAGRAARRAGTIAALATALGAPALLLVYAMVLWSGNAIVGRAVNEAIPPLALSFWRWMVAFVVLLPFTGREVWRLRGVVVRHWRLLVLYDALGIVGCNVLTYTALHETTAVNSSLINSATPIFVMCLAYLMFGDRIQLRQALGVGVSLAGVVAIISRGRLDTLSALAINRGDLMMLASIGLWSAYTALLRKKPDGLAPMPFLTVLMGLGVLLELPFYLAELALGATFTPTIPTLLAIGYVGVFPAAIALYFWNRAVAALGAARCSVFVHLMPVFGTALAVVFLGERPGLHHAVGIALIFTGVYLATLRRRAAA